MSQKENLKPSAFTAIVSIALFVPILASVFTSCDPYSSSKSGDVTVQQAPPAPLPAPLPIPTPTPQPGELLNQWSALNSISPPAARADHSAVWTGTRMIVWGGANGTIFFNDGASLNPLTGQWTPISATGAPSARSGHSAIWNGTRMIVWGGTNGAVFYNDGASYDPATNTWAPITNTNGLQARAGHSSVFTGGNMLTWGGASTATPNGFMNGGFYTLNAGWFILTGSDPFLARVGHSALWAAGRMIMFGGQRGGITSQDTLIFDPNTNVFAQVALQPNTPGNRFDHSAAWSGYKMIIWGGALAGITTSYMNDGRAFDPLTSLWSTITSTGAPSARAGHSAVWAGDAMIVWGGTSGPANFYNDGAVFR